MELLTGHFICLQGVHGAVNWAFASRPSKLQTRTDKDPFITFISCKLSKEPEPHRNMRHL